jgi:hypothetical protein
MLTISQIGIPRHVRIRIAVAAQVDPRKLERFLLGLPTRGGCARDRIDRALEVEGYGRDAEGCYRRDAKP